MPAWPGYSFSEWDLQYHRAQGDALIPYIPLPPVGTINRIGRWAVSYLLSLFYYYRGPIYSIVAPIYVIAPQTEVFTNNNMKEDRSNALKNSWDVFLAS